MRRDHAVEFSGVDDHPQGRARRSPRAARSSSSRPQATPYSALALAELAHRAGFPPGVLNVVTGDARAIGGEMCANPTVRKLSFTGSTEIGRMLMKQVAPTVKKISLELGGNAPFVVFDDADLDAAADGAIIAKYRNAGQTCVCTNRFFVHEQRLRCLRREARRAGEGAQGRSRHRGRRHAGTADRRRGASRKSRSTSPMRRRKARAWRPAASGTRSRGTFFEPTVLTDVTATMQIFREETFGPVAPLIRFSTDAEVIELANRTEFGLASYFYSRDIGRIWRVAEALEYGMVGVNTGLITTEVAPFGGVKQSGLGREGSMYGIDEFVQVKYVCFGASTAVASASGELLKADSLPAHTGARDGDSALARVLLKRTRGARRCIAPTTAQYLARLAGARPAWRLWLPALGWLPRYAGARIFQRRHTRRTGSALRTLKSPRSAAVRQRRNRDFSPRGNAAALEQHGRRCQRSGTIRPSRTARCASLASSSAPDAPVARWRSCTIAVFDAESMRLPVDIEAGRWPSRRASRRVDGPASSRKRLMTCWPRWLPLARGRLPRRGVGARSSLPYAANGRRSWAWRGWRARAAAAIHRACRAGDGSAHAPSHESASSSSRARARQVAPDPITAQPDSRSALSGTA